MLANIYRKFTEKHFLLRKYAFDKNIISTVRTNNELTYCRCLSICKYTKTDKNAFMPLLKNTQKFCTNITVTKEQTNFEELDSLTSQNAEITEADIETLLSLDWVNISPQEFISNFIKFSLYVQQIQKEPNINFDNLIQGATELSSKFSIQELCLIFKYTAEYIRTKNFYEIKRKILKSFNNELLKRSSELSTDEKLFFCSQYKNVNLSRKCYFVIRTMLKLSNRVKHMSSQQISTFMNILSSYISESINFYVIEHSIQDKWDNFSDAQLHQVLQAFFKNEYRLRTKENRVYIFNLISNKIKEMNPQHIGVMFKYLTLIYKISDKVDEAVEKILNSIELRVNELPLKTLVSVMSFAAHVSMNNKALIASIIERVNEEIQDLSVGEIDMITSGMAIFCYDPNHPLYANVLKELSNPNRQEEFSFHKKAFLRVIKNLVYVNIYPTNLIERVMDPKFIEENYKSNYSMQGCHFFLDQSIDVEYPNYTGPRLSEKLRLFFAKKYMSFELYDKRDLSHITRDVHKICEKLFEVPIYLDKILPQYYEKDFIFCYDENDNQISPEPFLAPLEYGVIKRIPEEAKNYKWLVLIITNWNMIFKHSGDYNGLLEIKCRQLKTLGYTPIVLSHKEWYSKVDDEQCDKYREDYVKKLLNIK